MAKTRSKPGNATPAEPKPKAKATLKTLDAPVESPPQLVVLPKDASPDARIVSIRDSRYFICPTKGFYEFTRISAPKSTPRSWLLAPDKTSEDHDESGYLLQNPSILLATPVDPLFLLLPSLFDESSSSTEYLAPSDYLSKLSRSSPHLTHILRTGNLEQILSHRIEAVSDCMDMGDNEKLYALSLPKLVQEIVTKAKRMAAKPLPKSMEEKFVKGALDVPVLSIRREESGLSVHDAGAGAEDVQSQDCSSNGVDSQDSETSTSTAATSISGTSAPEEKDTEIASLLRLRTSLDFLLKCYIPSSLSKQMEPLISTTIDWTPLTAHLERIAKMKKEAQALRSIGENFSRKRVLDEDEEGREEIKKRKKEEEARSKKSVSQGVRKLAKADRSGMKSLASFFGKK